RRRDAAAHVVRAAAQPDGAQRGENDVVYEHEIATLSAVPVDHRFLSARETLEEDRDDAAFEPGLLTRAVDVCEAERDVRGSMDAIPAREVLLAALLRDAVRRERLERRPSSAGTGHS